MVDEKESGRAVSCWLGPMPYRNSRIDRAHGVISGSFAARVFAQSQPTAHWLAQGPLAGALPTLGDSHLCDPSQGTAHDQTHARRVQQIRRHLQKLPQPLHDLQHLPKADPQHTHFANGGGLHPVVHQHGIGQDQRGDLLDGRQGRVVLQVGSRTRVYFQLPDHTTRPPTSDVCRCLPGPVVGGPMVPKAACPPRGVLEVLQRAASRQREGVSSPGIWKNLEKGRSFERLQ
jgi:hypothetical protein